MVYRGKPSPGCEPCRKRRAKCDGKKPGCGQCTRKSIDCHYRDLSDLYFQDQTSDVLRKQTARERKHQQQRQDGRYSSAVASSSSAIIKEESDGDMSMTWQASDAGSSRDASPNRAMPMMHKKEGHSPTSPPNIGLAEFALGFFMNIYVPTSPFDYLARPQYFDLRKLFETPPSPTGKPLPAAIQAAAYASLSLDKPDSPIANTARKYYAVALNLTNRALAARKPTDIEDLLVSVMLLSLFESILFRGRDSPVSWTAHSNGALTLLRMAGKEQFDTELGRVLFLHSSANIISGFLRRGEAAPPALGELYALVPDELKWHPAVQLGQKMEKLAALRARGLLITQETVAREGGMEELIDMLREARELELGFEEYGARTPKEWMTMLPPEETPSHAFQGRAQTFLAHMAARMWISIRLARLALNQRMFTATTRLLDYHHRFGGQLFEPDLAAELTAMHENSEARGRAMIIDSLAVVPYFWDPTSTKPAKAFGARVLIWPLAIAVQSELCEPDAREYAMATLKAIAGVEGGDDSSFPQAKEAVRMLEEEKVAEDWLCLWHLF